MKKQLRYGFTLVELLVVISIIGMLAGLLLPAINAARESGRRAVCMANQSQIAMALLNYENGRGTFPPMRGEVSSTSTNYGSAANNQGSWVAYLLPLMEYNAAYERLQAGPARCWDATTSFATFERLPIPILKCKSASLPTDDNTMSYVVNGGYQNGRVATASNWGTVSTVVAGGGGNDRFEPGRRHDAVFFDWFGHTNDIVIGPPDNYYWCKQTVSVDYISTHTGTSYTILLSENINAGQWIYTDTASLGRTWSGGEDLVAFCYPVNSHTDLDTVAKVYSATNNGSLVNYGAAGERSWYGYSQPLATTGTDPSYSPLFINVGRTIDTNVVTVPQYRQARPSSNHPGTVVAAFADRSTRTLNENMDKELFVRLCQPYSGAVINPASLNQ